MLLFAFGRVCAPSPNGRVSDITGFDKGRDFENVLDSGHALARTWTQFNDPRSEEPGLVIHWDQSSSI